MNQAGQNSGYEAVRVLLALRGLGETPVAQNVVVERLSSVFDMTRSTAWHGFVAEAEHHGVMPLVAPMIGVVSRTSAGLVPADAQRAVSMLASRQRRSSETRERWIDRLIVEFQSANIVMLLLKGAALAHCLYQNPALRPMVDIDILVDPKDAKGAREVALKMGFAFDRGYNSTFARELHHLPTAKLVDAGFNISLEIHLDAISPDQTDSLTLSTLADPPQVVHRPSGIDGRALGHIDMLRHLARHTFEPAWRVRLIHLFDLWLYGLKFQRVIDWVELDRRFPHVGNVLVLVRYVFEDEGAVKRAPNLPPAPDGVGFGMRPLSDIAASTMSFKEKLDALFKPSAWWLHGFYAVPPDRSLMNVRFVRHPATLTRWLTRRAWAHLAGLVLERRP